MGAALGSGGAWEASGGLVIVGGQPLRQEQAKRDASARVLRGCVRTRSAKDSSRGAGGAQCQAGPSASQPEVMGTGEQSCAEGWLRGAALWGSGSDQLTVTWQGGSWGMDPLPSLSSCPPHQGFFLAEHRQSAGEPLLPPSRPWSSTRHR